MSLIPHGSLAEDIHCPPAPPLPPSHHDLLGNEIVEEDCAANDGAKEGEQSQRVNHQRAALNLATKAAVASKGGMVASAPIARMARVA